MKILITVRSIIDVKVLYSMYFSGEKNEDIVNFINPFYQGPVRDLSTQVIKSLAERQQHEI